MLAFGLVLTGGLFAVSGIQDRSLREILKGITSHHQAGEPREGQTASQAAAEAAVSPSQTVAPPTTPGGATVAPAPSQTLPRGTLNIGNTITAFFQTELGLTRNQAAGITGNLQQESSLDNEAPGGGLDQGQGARANSGTYIQQLTKIKTELLGTERSTLQALRKTRTPQEAARVFSERFERPSIPDLANRETYAQEYAG